MLNDELLMFLTAMMVSSEYEKGLTTHINTSKL